MVAAPVSDAFWWVPEPPSTALQVARWILIVSSSYVVSRKILAYRRGKAEPITVALLSDGLFFSSSILVLMGVWWPEVIKAIGDLTPYLVLAGLGGFFYSAEPFFDLNSDARRAPKNATASVVTEDDQNISKPSAKIEGGPPPS